MYGSGACTPLPPITASSLWLCTMAAPASMQRTASAAISAGVRGTLGLRDFGVPPLSAASMITGAGIQSSRPAARNAVTALTKSS